MFTWYMLPGIPPQEAPGGAPNVSVKRGGAAFFERSPD